MANELAPEQWKAFADVLPYGAILHREERLFLNRIAEQITGYCTHEIQNFTDWLRKLYGAQWEKVQLLYQHDRSRGLQRERIMPITTKEGAMKWVACSGTLKGDAEIWILRDVSARYQVMDELRARNAALQARLSERTEELERVVNMLLTYREKINRLDASPKVAAQHIRLDMAREDLQYLLNELREIGDDLQDDGLADWSRRLQECHGILLQYLRNSD